MVYYFYKLYRIIVCWFFSKTFSPGVRYALVDHVPECVYLDHTDVRIMHLGDLLFFLEIVWLCQQSQIPVYLVGSGQLADFFSFFDVQHLSEFKQPGVILTKNDSPLFYHRSSHSIVGFNFWRLLGSGPVASLVLNQFQLFSGRFFSTWLLTPSSTSFYVEFRKRVADKFPCLNDSSNMIVVNSFVESQRLSSWCRLSAFNQFVKKQSVDQVVCVGSSNDLQQSIGYECGQDLRGSLSIMELIAYLSTHKIQMVVTFDTFLAHLALLLNLNMVVFVKSRFRRGIISNRFLPFFSIDSARITIK